LSGYQLIRKRFGARWNICSRRAIQTFNGARANFGYPPMNEPARAGEVRNAARNSVTTSKEVWWEPRDPRIGVLSTSGEERSDDRAAREPLRERLIEDMMVRNFMEKTRSDYVHHVKTLAAFLKRSPDTATPEDLRRFQLHQTETGARPPSINSSVSALRFFFTVTLDRPDMARHLTVVREPRRLPVVLSPDEVVRLLEAGTRTEVQGSAERCLWRGSAGLRGGGPEGPGRRRQTHDAED
jgi:hypothetical protein